MERNGGNQKEELFRNALQGKRIPILTLDHKWYRLFEVMAEEKAVCRLEKELNDLLKRQGKLNTETKDIKKLKKKLMNDIVTMVDEAEQKSTPSLEKKIEKNKQLIEECNEKLEAYQEELMELPKEIQEVNFELMLATMEYCYERMQENMQVIQEMEDWVTAIRIELKKNLIRKQEREIRNQEIYSYMHDIFSADVIDIFDMKYVPKDNPVKQKALQPQKEESGGSDPNSSDKEQA